MWKKNRSWILPVAYAAILILSMVLIINLGSTDEPEAKKVGFITPGSFRDPGWDARHYEGIKNACKSAGVELLVRDKIPENAGACPQAVKELVDEGADMIILSAEGYTHEMKPHFEEYSQISFYGIYANLEYSNVVGYSSRMFQARYLAGIVAGMQTTTGKIGFVAATDSYEVYRNVNAFTLGVRRVKPDAEVLLTLTGSPDNPEKDREAAGRLIQEAGVDVITHDQDQYTVIDVAEEAQIYSIGYQEFRSDLSYRFLTCATCEWEILYRDLLHEYLSGRRGEMLNNWLGLDSGVIRLTDYSPRVSQEAKDEVETAKAEILSGLGIFTNEIRDNEGNLRCGEGEALSDYTLNNEMDWLVEGVILYE